jgi:histidine triad (HIT) family protein
MSGCIFCRIASHQAAARILFEDGECLAFEDLHPKAPVHVLVIPKKHIAGLNADLGGEEPLLGRLLAAAARVAKEKGIDATGFRTVINTNAEAGQTIFHLHLHVMGGRAMKWPPG